MRCEEYQGFLRFPPNSQPERQDLSLAFIGWTGRETAIPGVGILAVHEWTGFAVSSVDCSRRSPENQRAELPGTRARSDHIRAIGRSQNDLVGAGARPAKGAAAPPRPPSCATPRLASGSRRSRTLSERKLCNHGLRSPGSAVMSSNDKHDFIRYFGTKGECVMPNVSLGSHFGGIHRHPAEKWALPKRERGCLRSAGLRLLEDQELAHAERAGESRQGHQ